ANRCATNAEFREFIDDGGYRDPALWLSEGWDLVRHEGWSHPLYWDDALETSFGLGGRQALDPAAPVCHVGFFEADAFARWAGARLPTEFEWEAMAHDIPIEGNFVDSGALRPWPAHGDRARPLQMFGDVWECTSSPYVGYPGYRPASGALGEYNGKFTCGRATAISSIRRRAGSSAASAWRGTHEIESAARVPSGRPSTRRRSVGRCAGRPFGISEKVVVEILLRRARFGAVRTHLRTARVLPDAGRAFDHARTRRRDRRGVGSGCAPGGIRQRQRPEDALAAAEPRVAGSLRSGRNLAQRAGGKRWRTRTRVPAHRNAARVRGLHPADQAAACGARAAADGRVFPGFDTRQFRIG